MNSYMAGNAIFMDKKTINMQLPGLSRPLAASQPPFAAYAGLRYTTPQLAGDRIVTGEHLRAYEHYEYYEYYAGKTRHKAR